MLAANEAARDIRQMFDNALSHLPDTYGFDCRTISIKPTDKDLVNAKEFLKINNITADKKIAVNSHL